MRFSTEARTSRRQVPHWELLAVMLLLIALYLVRQPGYLSGSLLRVIDDVLILAIAVLAMTRAQVSRTTLLIHAGLGVVATGVAIAAEVTSANELERVATAISAYVLVASAIAILRTLLRQSRVSPDTVFGGLAVYLAVGMVFAMTYTALARSDPAQFQPPQLVLLSDASMYYFSFVTLTGLGYGDIVPVTDFTRSLATMEALIGTLLLVTLVSRIVGLLVAQRSDQASVAKLEALDAKVDRLQRSLESDRPTNGRREGSAGADPAKPTRDPPDSPG